MIELVVAQSAEQFSQGRALFQEYAAQLNVDLCFQGFSAELDRLPEMYGPPRGRLLLAHDDGALCGCAGVRPLTADPAACEMKRLYVRTSARGQGLGRRLAMASLDAARDMGYARMVLDTLPRMTEALALYASLGFTPIDPYYTNPIEGVVYLERRL
ncbi:MAG: GNAT family N-acetyltransferase [Vicinamibacterales bacterium]